VRGADKSVTNNAKQTVYDVANISSHKNAANILSKHDVLLIGGLYTTYIVGGLYYLVGGLYHLVGGLYYLAGGLYYLIGGLY